MDDTIMGLVLDIAIDRLFGYRTFNSAYHAVFHLTLWLLPV